MQIHLDRLTWLQVLASSCICVQASVSFNIFDALMPVSYLVLFMSLLFFLVMGMLFCRRPQMTFFDFACTMFFILLLSITIVNGANIKDCIYVSAGVLLTVLLFNYFRKNLKLIILSLGITFSLLIYANMALMLMFPDWIFMTDEWDRYLLGGNYNSIGIRLITAIIVNYVCTRYYKKWMVNLVMLVIVSVATLLLVGSMTAVTGVILFTLTCFIPSVRLQKIAFVSFFTFYVLFQVGVCFQGEGLQDNPLAVYFIQDILGKNLTFTNRTVLWDAAGRLFWQSPIIGYGYVDNDWFYTHLASFAIGPHNFIYFILLSGGILLLSVFITAIALAFRRIWPHLDRMGGSLLLGLTTVLFMQTMEVYPFFFNFLLLALIYYYPELKSTWEKPLPQEPTEETTET